MIRLDKITQRRTKILIGLDNALLLADKIIKKIYLLDKQKV